jgi:hypothetical protein
MSDFIDAAKGILSAVAPTVATALGGPMAGMAVKAIVSAFDLPENSTQEQVMNAVAGATPEQLAKLKEVDNNFKIQMRKLEIDLERIAMEDRNSARQREASVKDNTPKILAYLITLLYIGIQVFLITSSINEDMREIVMRALGTLDAILGLVFGYYFGSSVGSKEKQKHLDEMVKK